MNVMTLAKSAGLLVRANAPVVLAVAGVAGLVGTSVLAAQGAVKAKKVLEERGLEDAPFEVKFKTTWKFFIPALSTGLATAAVMVTGNYKWGKAASSLAATMAMNEAAQKSLLAYKEKAAKAIGQEKADEIHREVIKEQVAGTKLGSGDVHIYGKGQHICFDTLSGRYFMSDANTIQAIENSINKRLVGGSASWISLNELYNEIGLPNIRLGEETGWYADNLIDLSFSGMVADDGTPVLALEYVVDPQYDPYR